MKENSKMIKEIYINGVKTEYDLTYKKVKNINMIIKSDKTIHISANKRIPEKVIEDFILSKAGFIIKALKKYDDIKPPVKYYNEDELKAVVLKICKEVYPYYERLGIKYPVIKFRKMVSMWGNCKYLKGELTFSTNLVYADYDCIKYVVLHEFTHFLVHDHSKKFYTEMEKVCPCWKDCRERMKKIILKK